LKRQDNPKPNSDKYLLRIIGDEIKALKELFSEQKLLVLTLLVGLLAFIYLLGHTSTKEIILAADQKGSSWYLMAEKSRGFVENTGFKYDIRTSDGTLQNAELLKDPSSEVNVAFLIPGALDPETNKSFYSLGSIDYEPIWIFYRKEIGGMSALADLAKYKVGVGPTKSGRFVLTEKLFALNHIEIRNNKNFISNRLGEQLGELQEGKLDAVIFIGQAYDANVRLLAKNPDLKLYDFNEADAYTKNLSFLQKVTVPAGSFDIAERIPQKAVTLIAITTTLAVRRDTHPTVQLAVLLAARDAERSAESLFFSKRNEFPVYMDPLIELSPIAQRFYDYGPPVLLNYFPFWAATLVDRFSLYLFTLWAILYPLTKLNLHLRNIRYKIKTSRDYTELITLNQKLNSPDLTLEGLKALKQKLNDIQIRASTNHIPVGEESDYFSFIRAVHNLQGDVNKRIAEYRTEDQ
jgi:TRAP-type uncharacterized transport system substrate-binding protein